MFLIGVSVELIDRPVATWVHDHLGASRLAWFNVSHDDHPLVIGPFSLMAGPSEVLRPLALGVLIVVVLAAATGWRPETRGRTALAFVPGIIAGVYTSVAVGLATADVVAEGSS